MVVQQCGQRFANPHSRPNRSGRLFLNSLAILSIFISETFLVPRSTPLWCVRPTRAILICLALVYSSHATAQGLTGAPVEVVATATEYVPSSVTVSHPGHAYTNCMGTTSFFGEFSSYGNFGDFSGTAYTNTHCGTTFSPPSESTLTTYRKVNYTIVKGKQALYLLSCTQTWEPTPVARALSALQELGDAATGDQGTVP